MCREIKTEMRIMCILCNFSSSFPYAMSAEKSKHKSHKHTTQIILFKTQCHIQASVFFSDLFIYLFVYLFIVRELKFSLLGQVDDGILILMKPSRVAYMAEEPEEPGSKPGPAHISVETDHEIFSTTIFPLSLIQDYLLCTIYEHEIKTRKTALSAR